YEEAAIDAEAEHVAGAATGQVFAEVLDPRLVPEGRSYTLEFLGDEPIADRFRVVADGVTVAEAPVDDVLSTVFDGVRLLFNNDVININPSLPTQQWQFRGSLVPYDYEIRFSDDLVGQSIGGFRLGTGNAAPMAVATETNFTVHNVTLDRPAPFVFLEPSVANR